MSKEAYPVFRTRPPHPNGGSDKQKARRVAVGAASSAATLVGNDGDPTEYVVFISTTLCHIVFGDANVSDATTTDVPIPPFTYVRLDLRLKEETHFKVIRNSADGFLHWWIPGG